MKPMENIRVVELSTMLAGPMTARILAEWGAVGVHGGVVSEGDSNGPLGLRRRTWYDRK